jgi:acetyl esterase
VSRAVSITEITVPSTDTLLRARVYRARTTSLRTLPLVINFHGGGFVLGNLTAADWLCGQLAARAGVTVVSIAYRLAPEYPAPVPFLDAWTATRWLVQHAALLRADPLRVTLVGESAGANLAALVALASRDRSRAEPAWPPLAGQILAYPAVDLTLSSPSIDERENAPMLRRATLAWYGRLYLPQDRPDSLAYDDPQVSPIFAGDHTDLAPALIISAGLDPLRDDARRYAETLRAAGVPTELVEYPDAIHGFLSIPLFEPDAYLALDRMVSWLGTLR